MTWETVIGLEVHAQLATKSKIFSGSSTEFGAEPNTQANAVDLAMPGTLPVLNEEALRYAVMFGLAMNAQINTTSVFERKNYFYPDLPKGYQTSQLAQPIVGAGEIEIELADGSSKKIRLHHAHLEEDAGKSLHEDFHGMSGIDLNRAGTPLIEIVSEPDMRSAEEAVAYAKKLHSIVTTLRICDGDMSQGSMRFDVNISVRKKGDPLGTRTETKNLNSFRFMEEAIALEVERQIDLIEDGGKVKQETRLYNGDTKTARSMRSKEEANDYRYFPCPDLLPVVIDPTYIEAIRKTLPELPDVRKQRFADSFGLSSYDASVLSSTRAMADYFEATRRASMDAIESGQDTANISATNVSAISNHVSAQETSQDTASVTGNNTVAISRPGSAQESDPDSMIIIAKLTANWILGEVSAQLNRSNLDISQSPVSAQQLGTLIARIKDGTISGKGAKDVFRLLFDKEGNDVDSIIETRGLKQVSDTGAIEKIVDDVLASNAQQVDNYRAAAADKRPKMLGFFVGQIMKASKGQANPALVNELLVKKLES